MNVFANVVIIFKFCKLEIYINMCECLFLVQKVGN